MLFSQKMQSFAAIAFFSCVAFTLASKYRLFCPESYFCKIRLRCSYKNNFFFFFLSQPRESQYAARRCPSAKSPCQLKDSWFIKQNLLVSKQSCKYPNDNKKNKNKKKTLTSQDLWMYGMALKTTGPKKTFFLQLLHIWRCHLQPLERELGQGEGHRAQATSGHRVSSLNLSLDRCCCFFFPT